MSQTDLIERFSLLGDTNLLYGALVAFCERHHLRKMLIFGSVLRSDFGPESDIDILVEFDPDHIPGWEFYTWADELEALLGRPVDLGTPNSLSPHIRERVMQSAQVIYERP